MICLKELNGRNIWDILELSTYPCGRAEKCWLSYEPENITVHRLHSLFGFVPNGEKYAEEIIAELDL